MHCPGSKLFPRMDALLGRRAVQTALLAAFAFGPCCFAQKWEVGLAGGYGFYNDATVKPASGGSAELGFQRQFAAGAALDEDVSEHIGGELRYTFRGGDSRIHSGGTEATMQAMSQAIDYDFLFYATPRHARVRPFLAAGGGIKRYDGTGFASATQPLANFARLRNGHQVEGMLSVGGGIKAYLSDRWVLRVNFRDFATPVPDNLFATSRSTKVSGWL